MLYTEFMNKVCDVSILKDEITGRYFIDPFYKYNLQTSNLDHSYVSDMFVTEEDVKEFLELEVNKRNTLINKSYLISDWIFELIYYGIEEIKGDTQNNMLKELIEYIILKKELHDAENGKEKEEIDSKIKKIGGFNFSKKNIE